TGVPDARLARDGAALGEAREHDVPGYDASATLAGNECLHPRLRGADALGVLSAVVADVVPRAHARAAVDGDSLDRRVREDEAHRRRRRQRQLGHDRLEVVAVGTEAVKPDDGGPGGRARLDLDGLEQLAHAGAQSWVSLRTRSMSVSWSRVARRCFATTRRPCTHTSVMAWGDIA